MKQLVIRLSGDASGLPGEVVSVAQSLARARGPRPDQVTILGSEHDLGYGLALLATAALRPRVVEFAGSGQIARRLTFRRAITGRLAGAFEQLAASGGAVAAQRLAAAGLAIGNGPRRGRGELRAVIYLRPHVGVPAGVGGSVTHSHGVIRALRAAGLEVDALTTDPAIVATAAADPDPPCDWQLERIAHALRALPASAALGADVALARAAAPLARQAQLIYQRHARFSLAGALLARRSGLPLALEYNGSEAFFATAWQRAPLAAQLLRCENVALGAAAIVIVNSRIDHDDLIRRGVAREKLVLSPNGVEVERFDRGGGEQVRAVLGIDPGAPLIGFAGSFGPWHGAPLLARAFVAVAAKLPDARLLMLGDGPERAEAAAVLAGAGLSQRAALVGKVHPATVPGYLDACDVLASPHVQLPGGVEFFGSPTKLFEYMAAGKAIVASRLGQIGEVLEHERTALLVPAGDVDALAAALLQTLRNVALRSRLGAAARADAVAKHSWAVNVEQLLEAYRRLDG